VAEEKQGWTRFFKKKDLAGEDFFGKVLSGLARVFEGGDEQETYKSIRAEMKAIFSCDDISLFAFDPTTPPSADEGDWVLTVKAGFGEGNRVSQADAKSCPDLAVGRAAAFTDELAQQAALKAVALAFEDNAFYGCDIEKSKVLLLKDPRPEDDLGSGDLSVLAIPLRYTQKVGKVVEQTKVGVLALFKTPNRRELGDLEKGLRSLLAHALVTPACTLRDPVTGLYTEAHLRDELARYLNMFEMTGGQLNGGLIVGMVDCLKLYKTTLESAGKVDPTGVGTQISEALRGVAGCVWRRATSHQLGPNEELKCGIAGRFGHNGFAVILPLVKPFEMSMFATRLSQDVVKTKFEAEQHLPGGQLTVSQRLIPFGPSMADPAAAWKLARKTIDDLETDQARARRDAGGLKEVVKSVKMWDRGNWVNPSEFKGDQPAS
jgi:GGDEF domain-containing protein